MLLSADRQPVRVCGRNIDFANFFSASPGRTAERGDLLIVLAAFSLICVDLSRTSARPKALSHTQPEWRPARLTRDKKKKKPCAQIKCETASVVSGPTTTTTCCGVCAALSPSQPSAGVSAAFASPLAWPSSSARWRRRLMSLSDSIHLAAAFASSADDDDDRRHYSNVRRHEQQVREVLQPGHHHHHREWQRTRPLASPPPLSTCSGCKGGAANQF